MVCRLIVPEEASASNPMARERCARGLAKTVRHPRNVLVHTWLGRRLADAWVFNISRLDVPNLPCRIKARSHSCRLHASGGLGRLSGWHVKRRISRAGVHAIGTRNTWVFGCLLVGVTVGDTLRKSSYFGRLRVAVGITVTACQMLGPSLIWGSSPRNQRNTGVRMNLNCA